MRAGTRRRRREGIGGCWLAAVVVATGLAMHPAGGAAQTGAPANGEWPTYGGDLGSTKYSPLDQIDGNNFGDLEVAWRWQSADGWISLTTPAGGEAPIP